MPRFPRVTRPLIALLLLIPTAATAQSPAPQRDYSFLVFSDIHLGVEKPKATPPVTAQQSVQRVRQNLELMRGLAGRPFPNVGALAALDLGAIAPPRGLFILGDLTDGHKELSRRQEQWNSFEDLFPAAGVKFGDKAVPVFAAIGNHDGELAGPQGQGLVRHHRDLKAAGQLAALSDNGLHFAVEWDGVHFICVNLCPADTVDEQNIFKYGKPGKGSWNDPQGALTFLKEYLQNKVGASGRPVFILQHYGFDGFSMNDWNWWTPRQRRAMYDALRDYNVVAIVHGHNHHAEHYRWPDPKKHAADLQAMFGDAVPAQVRSFDIISCGGVAWLFRIRGNQFIAAHFKGPDWSKNAADYIVKDLEPAGPAGAVQPNPSRPGHRDRQ